MRFNEFFLFSNTQVFYMILTEHDLNRHKGLCIQYMGFRKSLLYKGKEMENDMILFILSSNFFLIWIVNSMWQ